MARTASPPAPTVHFVVDGSNIATEGRAMPSLEQLNDAVLAFIDEHPDALITVVVDATFGHRIDASEVKAFDEAVANNELVTPPAGAVGRGDAFVLTIAHKAKAGILSNDSFQEFHGDYPWLFDAGRLIGGKPVPHVGWVFVERLPVRGPKSRQSVKEAKQGRPSNEAARPRVRGGRTRGSGSPLADQPMPVPTSPPPGVIAPTAPPVVVAPKGRRSAATAAASAEVVAVAQAAVAAPPPAQSKSVNELVPFLEFVAQHPVGTSCTVVVESYASHGAYARSGDVLVYLPLRLMGNPMPRSARSAVSIGDAVAVVIAGYTPERRSIDAALPSGAEVLAAPAAAPTPEPATPRKRASKKAAATPAAAPAEAAPTVEAVEPIVTPEAPADKPPRPARKRVAKAPPAEVPAVAVAPEVQAPAEPKPKRSSRRSTPGPAESPVEAPAVAVPVAEAAPTARKQAAKAAPAKRAAAKPRAVKSSVPSPPPEPVAPVEPAKPVKRTTKQRSRTKPSSEAVD